MATGKIKFNNLLSNDEIARDSSFDALDYALKQDRIKNIGITGNYGSGKSSFIDTYIKGKSEKLKFLRISLASFSNIHEKNQKAIKFQMENNDGDNEGSNSQNDIDIKSQTKDNNEVIEDKSEISDYDNEIKTLDEKELKNIEISILQQMLYKKSANALPNSRFSRIRKTDREQVASVVKNLCFFIAFFLLFLFPTYLLEQMTILKFDFVKPMKLLVRIVCFIQLFYIGKHFLISIISRISNISLKKVSIKDAEFEIKNNVSDSILNKRLDEILYFFEMTDYDVVVFEDLDRFNNNEIFVHLREINSIINDYENIKRKISFIYATKDQMFLNEERVKFFDFIIPIIPILNSSNAASELIKNQREKNRDYFEGISDSYFTEIGAFINDMRLLKNVVNEYLLYHSKLNPSSKNEEKLFSLILYKNLFPEDFSKMQRKAGDIELAFNWKKRIANKLKNANNSKINSYQEHIEKIKKECIKNKAELKLIYLTEYARLQALPIDSNQLYKLSKDNSFLDTKTEATFLVYINSYQQRPINFDYSYFEKITIDGLSYLDRRQIVENGITSEENHYLELIRKEKDSQSKLLMMPFSEIYNRASDEDKKELHLSEKQLYFLRRNFIDENYIDYISLFKEGVLTKTENDFINSVRIKDEMAPNTALKNIPVILERIKDEFINNSPALLNFNLLNYLLDNKADYEIELRALLNQIIDENNLIFLNNYISQNDSVKYFNASIELVDVFWDKLFKRANTEVDILEYCYLIIKAINNQMRDVIAKNTSFVSFINKHSDILRMIKNEDDIEKILNNLKLLKVCFESLDTEDLDNILIFEYIISNVLFKMNKQNIYTLTQKLDNTTDGVYTKILKSNNKDLINFINQNLNIFVKEILLDSNEINEDENSILQLLNSETISFEDKYEIIIKMDKQILVMSKIDNPDLYDVLLKENKVFPNWENIYTYYKIKNSISDILISYIYENYKKIGEEKFDEKNEFKQEYSSFATYLYQNEKISVEEIENLEKNNEYYLNDFDYKLISKEKLEKLIENDSIDFSQRNLDLIRSINQELANKFVLKNKTKYMKSYTEYNLSYSELSTIIDDEGFSNEEKILILRQNLDKLCSPDVKINILELIEEGDLYKVLSKQHVINLLNSKDFMFGLNKNEKRMQKRILLLAKTSSLFDDSEFIKELTQFEDDFEKLNSQKTVTIDDKKGNLLPLCEALQDKKIIHNYKVSNGKIILRK